MSSFTLQGYLNFINTASPNIRKITAIITNCIHRGLKTSHHDHVITPHSFNTINAIKSNDNTPGP